MSVEEDKVYMNKENQIQTRIDLFNTLDPVPGYIGKDMYPNLDEQFKKDLK